MKQIVKEKYDKQQQKIINSKKGKFKVSAGPGSGKTHTLVGWVVNRINEGVDPSSIMVTTFSRNAADELKRRIANETNENVFYELDRIGTTHSILYQEMLNYPLNELEEYKWSEYKVFNQSSSKKDDYPGYYGLFENIKKELDCNVKVNTLVRSFSAFKNNLILPHLKDLDRFNKNFQKECRKNIENEFVNKKIIINTKSLEAFKLYQEKLIEYKMIDMDDMLLLPYLMLNLKDSSFLERLKSEINYLICDESQDNNRLQNNILKLISPENIGFIGDSDQSMYSFRGAVAQEFIEKQSKEKLFLLENNYRSEENIVKVANRLIKHNVNRIERETKPTREAKNDSITVNKFNSYDEEVEFVTECIKEKYLDKNGEPLPEISNVAILSRTNAVLEGYERSFTKANIPFRSNGKRFYERNEIVNMLSFLKLYLDINDNDSFIKVWSCFKPNKKPTYVPTKTLRELGSHDSIFEKLEEKILTPTNTRPDKNLIKNVKIFFTKWDKIVNTDSLSEFFENVFEYYYKDHLDIDSDEQDMIGLDPAERNIIENIKTLINVTNHIKLDEADDYLEFIEKTMNKKNNEKDNCVMITTFHGAKGLEWDTVYIVSCHEGNVPHKNSTENTLEEERNMMYVAITRAMNYLNVSWVGDDKSRFIDEAGLMDYKPKKKKKRYSKNKTEYINQMKCVDNISNELPNNKKCNYRKSIRKYNKIKDKVRKVSDKLDIPIYEVANIMVKIISDMEGIVLIPGSSMVRYKQTDLYEIARKSRLSDIEILKNSSLWDDMDVNNVPNNYIDIFKETNRKYSIFASYVAIAEILGFEFDIKKDCLWLVTRDDNGNRMYLENVTNTYNYEKKYSNIEGHNPMFLELLRELENRN